LTVFLLTLSVLFTASLPVFPSSYIKVITDPPPNLLEKNFKLLKKVREIKDEVGIDEYLFMPYSIAMDRNNNLFIYDRGQAKILVFDASFKFIKSFGAVGAGPGEFSGSGKFSSVPIQIGPDGKLYAYDHNANKVLVFDTDGKFVRQIKINPSLGFNFKDPTADKSGNLIFQEFRGDRLVIFSEKGEILFSMLNKEKEKEYLFAENKIFLRPGQEDNIPKNEPFSYDGSELQIKITANSKLFLYFTAAATLYIVDLNDRENAKKFRIWPEEAVKLRKAELEKMKFGYACLFSPIIPDGDQSDLFYVDFGKNKDRKSECLYRLNLEGNLMGVLYIPITEGSATPMILLKQNNFFFAREDDKVVVYQE